MAFGRISPNSSVAPADVLAGVSWSRKSGGSFWIEWLPLMLYG